MRALVWVVFAVLALLWTGAAWAVAAMLGFAAQVAHGDAVADPAMLLSHWSLPAWLVQWLGVETLHRGLDAMTSVLDLLAAAGPWLAGMLEWVVPVVWVMWAVGMSLLLPTLALHAATRPAPRPPGDPPSPGLPAATGSR